MAASSEGATIPEPAAERVLVPVSVFVDGFNVPSLSVDASVKCSLAALRAKIVEKAPSLAQGDWGFALDGKGSLVPLEREATTPVRKVFMRTLCHMDPARKPSYLPYVSHLESLLQWDVRHHCHVTRNLTTDGVLAHLRAADCSYPKTKEMVRDLRDECKFEAKFCIRKLQAYRLRNLLGDRPESIARQVLECVRLFVQGCAERDKNEAWSECETMVRNKGFTKQLARTELGKGANDATLTIVESIFAVKSFTFENANRRDRNLGMLFRWVSALRRYHAIERTSPEQTEQRHAPLIIVDVPEPKNTKGRCRFSIVTIRPRTESVFYGPWSPELGDAVWNGDAASAVSKLLDAAPDALNAPDSQGLTLLHYAALKGRTELAGLLAARGANAATRDRTGRTPLHCAVEKRDHATLRLLLARCENPAFAISFMDQRGRTVFDYAAEAWKTPELWTALTEWASPPQAALLTCLSQRSDLFEAARSGDVDTMRQWLDTEPMPPENWCRCSPRLKLGREFYLRCERCGSGACERSRGWGGRCDRCGKQIVSHALVPQRPEPRPELGLRWVDAVCVGRTALHVAADAGQLAVAQLLLERGASADATDHLGNTPAHCAALRGHTNILEALRDGKSTAEASFCARNAHGETPLHLAARARSATAVALLIKVAAEAVRMADRAGATPTHIAASSGWTQGLELLLPLPATRMEALHPPPLALPARGRTRVGDEGDCVRLGWLPELSHYALRQKASELDLEDLRPFMRRHYRRKRVGPAFSFLVGRDARYSGEAQAGDRSPGPGAYLVKGALGFMSPSWRTRVVENMFYWRTPRPWVQRKKRTPRRATRKIFIEPVRPSGRLWIKMGEDDRIPIDHMTHEPVHLVPDWEDRAAKRGLRMVRRLQKTHARCAHTANAFVDPSVLHCAVLSRSEFAVAMVVKHGLTDDNTERLLGIALEQDVPAVVDAVAILVADPSDVDPTLATRFWRYQVGQVLNGRTPPSCPLLAATLGPVLSVLHEACMAPATTVAAITWAASCLGITLASGNVAVSAPAPVASAIGAAVSPLAAAAATCSAEVLELLLGCGLDPSVPDASGRSALAHAAEGGNLECLRLLIARGCCQTERTLRERPLGAKTISPTAVACAVRNGSREALAALLQGDAASDEGIATAVSCDDADAVRVLCQHGANPDVTLPLPSARTSKGSVLSKPARVSVIAAAVAKRSVPMLRALLEGGADAVSFLFSGLAMPLTKNGGPWRPAALRDFLLRMDQGLPRYGENGEDAVFCRGLVLLPAPWDRTRCERGSILSRIEALAQLAKKGIGEVAACIGLHPWDGDYPVAPLGPSGARLPLSPRADESLRAISASYRAELRPVVADALVRGADPNGLPGCKLPPLGMACLAGDVELVRLLLRCGADPVAKNGQLTPICYCVKANAAECAEALLDGSGDRVKELLSVPVHYDNRTPLAYIASFGDVSVMAVLVARGAEVDAPNSEGRTALSFAEGPGHVAQSLWLLEHGANPHAAAPRGRSWPLLCTACWLTDSAPLMAALLRSGLPLRDLFRHDNADDDYRVEAAVHRIETFESTPAVVAAAADRVGPLEYCVALVVCATAGDDTLLRELLTNTIPDERVEVLRRQYSELRRIRKKYVSGMGAFDFTIEDESVAHRAAKQGLSAALRVCVQYQGVFGPVAVADAKGYTALHYAAGCTIEKGLRAVRMVETLLATSAVASPANFPFSILRTELPAADGVAVLTSLGGDSPLHCAIRAGNNAVVDMLLKAWDDSWLVVAMEHGDDQQARSGACDTLATWRGASPGLRSQPARVHFTRRAPLVLAAERNASAMVSAILNCGLRVCHATMIRQLPGALMAAAARGAAAALTTLLAAAHAQRVPAADGLLHIACQAGSLEAVKAILAVSEYEKQLWDVDSQGDTAADIAHAVGAIDVVGFLRQRGATVACQSLQGTVKQEQMKVALRASVLETLTALLGTQVMKERQEQLRQYVPRKPRYDLSQPNYYCDEERAALAHVVVFRPQRVARRSESLPGPLLSPHEGEYLKAPGLLGASTCVEVTTLDGQVGWVRTCDVVSLEKEAVMWPSFGLFRLVMRVNATLPTPPVAPRIAEPWTTEYRTSYRKLSSPRVPTGVASGMPEISLERPSLEPADDKYPITPSTVGGEDLFPITPLGGHNDAFPISPTAGDVPPSRMKSPDDAFPVSPLAGERVHAATPDAFPITPTVGSDGPAILPARAAFAITPTMADGQGAFAATASSQATQLAPSETKASTSSSTAETSVAVAWKPADDIARCRRACSLIAKALLSAGFRASDPVANADVLCGRRCSYSMSLLAIAARADDAELLSAVADAGAAAEDCAAALGGLARDSLLHCAAAIVLCERCDGRNPWQRTMLEAVLLRAVQARQTALVAALIKAGASAVGVAPEWPHNTPPCLAACANRDRRATLYVTHHRGHESPIDAFDEAHGRPVRLWSWSICAPNDAFVELCTNVPKPRPAVVSRPLPREASLYQSASDEDVQDDEKILLYLARCTELRRQRAARRFEERLEWRRLLDSIDDSALSALEWALATGYREGVEVMTKAGDARVDFMVIPEMLWHSDKDLVERACVKPIQSIALTGLEDRDVCEWPCQRRPYYRVNTNWDRKLFVDVNRYIYGPMFEGPLGRVEDTGIRCLNGDVHLIASLKCRTHFVDAMEPLNNELALIEGMSPSFKGEVELHTEPSYGERIAPLVASSLVCGRFARAAAVLACDERGRKLLGQLYYHVTVTHEGEPTAFLEESSNGLVLRDRVIWRRATADTREVIDACDLEPVLLEDRFQDFIGLHILPLELILTKIFDKFNPRTLFRCAQVSKAWQEIAMDPMLWDPRYVDVLPYTYPQRLMHARSFIKRHRHSGRSFYLDYANGTTTWDKPPLPLVGFDEVPLPLVSAQGEGARRGPFPPQYEVRILPDGRKIFAEHTQRISWNADVTTRDPRRPPRSSWNSYHTESIHTRVASNQKAYYVDANFNRIMWETQRRQDKTVYAQRCAQKEGKKRPYNYDDDVRFKEVYITPVVYEAEEPPPDAFTPAPRGSLKFAKKCLVAGVRSWMIRTRPRAERAGSTDESEED